MPTYEVEVNGQTYEIDAPDDNAVQIAVRQLQGVGKPQGRHLSYEEGAALLDQEQRDQAANSTMGQAGAGGASFLEGIPVIGPAILGGVQRAAAGIGSMIDGESYDTNLKQAQQTTQDAQAANPVTSTVGGIAGSVAGTIPMVAAAPAAFGISGASLPARMLAAGASGAVVGGADGGIRDGVEGAVWGAGLGGGLGLAGPVVGDMAGKAVRSVLGNRATAEAARMAGTSKPAVDVVARSLGADDATGAVNARISSAGPGAMLADAGPSTQTVLDTAIQRAGPGAGRAAARIDQRALSEYDKIIGVLDDTMGKPGESLSRDLIVYGDKTNPMSLLYKKAYATPIDYSNPMAMEIERLVKTRVPPSAIKAANDLMRTEGVESAQILAKIADDGSVVLERLPDVRQLDYITRGLNQVAQEADGKGVLGGTTQIGRAYGNLAGEIRGRLKQLVPEYQSALDRAGTEIGKVKAEKFGTTLLSEAVTRADVKEFAEGISQAERNKLTQAVRLDIDDKLARVKAAFSDSSLDAREASAALKLLSSRANREKVATAIGEGRAKQIFDQLDQSVKAFELRAGVTTNSRTYARQAAERAVGQATAPSILETAASGSPIKTVQGALRGFMGTSDADMLARQDATWSEIADLLTQPAGRAGGTFLQALQGAAQRLPVIDRQAAAVARGVTGGVAIGAAPSRRLVQN